MLSRITLLSMLLFSGAALADGTKRPAPPVASKAPAAPAVNLPPINLDEVDEQCKPIAKQASAVSVPVALSARVSLANCIADTKLAKLTLLDCEDSVLAVDDAAKQSFELIDGVIAGATDESTKIVAEQAKAELYNQMIARMMKTLPAHDGTASSIAMHDARKGILDGLVVKWKDAAAVSYENILAIVKAKPALEKNPVVAQAMRTAKDRLRLHVASAKPAPAPVEADDKAPKTDSGEELR
jgi:hypothetical protein